MLFNLQRLLVQLSTTVVASLLVGSVGTAQSGIVAWGDNSFGQLNVPALPAGLTYIEMVTGWQSTIATRSDGSAVAWGLQTTVPPPPPGLTYVQFAAGTGHSAALLSDGSVAAWGSLPYGQLTVPAFPPGVVCVQVAAGYAHQIALLSDGTLRAWGGNNEGQLNIPALPTGLTYVDVRAAFDDNVAKRSDGSFVAWGWNAVGQANIPALPPGLSYVEISIGYEFMLGRRSDGSVVAWGNNNRGQATVPVLPFGTKYVEVDAGYEHAIARRTDGSLVAWGRNDFGQTAVPFPPGPYYRFAKVSSGAQFSLALIEPSDPTTYCTAKVNSVGCTPSISYSGLPSYSGPDNFHVTASNVLNSKPGIMLWSLNSGAIPFFGGTLCVAAPITRTPGQSSGGTPVPAQDCSGTYSYHFTQGYMLAQLLPPSTNVRAQYWSRDPGSGLPHSANNIGLTNALSFVIFP